MPLSKLLWYKFKNWQLKKFKFLLKKNLVLPEQGKASKIIVGLQVTIFVDPDSPNTDPDPEFQVFDGKKL